MVSFYAITDLLFQSLKVFAFPMASATVGNEDYRASCFFASCEGTQAIFEKVPACLKHCNQSVQSTARSVRK